MEALDKLIEFPDREALERFMIAKIEESYEKDWKRSQKPEWDIVAASSVLGALESEVGIVPLIKLLDILKEDVESAAFISILRALKEMGAPALEPVYAKYLEYRDDEFDSLPWLEIMSCLGVYDLRIKTAIFECFTFNPTMAIVLMTFYGDHSFLPLIEEYVKTSAAILNENEIDPFNSENPLDDALVENYLDTRDALVILKNIDNLEDIDMLTETEALDRKLLKHSKFSWFKEGIKPVRNLKSKIGRNDPCPCGSGRKFKDCHGKG